MSTVSLSSCVCHGTPPRLWSTPWWRPTGVFLHPTWWFPSWAEKAGQKWRLGSGRSWGRDWWRPRKAQVNTSWKQSVLKRQMGKWVEGHMPVTSLVKHVCTVCNISVISIYRNICCWETWCSCRWDCCRYRRLRVSSWENNPFSKDSPHWLFHSSIFGGLSSSRWWWCYLIQHQKSDDVMLGHIVSPGFPSCSLTYLLTIL